MSSKWFEPYIVDFEIVPGRKFVVGTKQAKDWYDPLPDALREELRWIRENIDLGKGRNVLDGGCHHGVHTITMAGECNLLAIDIHKPNLTMLFINAGINGLKVDYSHAAILHQEGVTFYNGAPLGVVTTKSDDQVKINCFRIPTLMPDVNVVKLDIEGSEHVVIPDCIDELDKVDTWIVEMHPFVKTDDMDGYASMYDMLRMFEKRNYSIDWVDRSEEEPKAKPYMWEVVNMYSTFFMRRDLQ